MHNTGLAKVAVQCSADAFVVKIATFAKPKKDKEILPSEEPERNKYPKVLNSFLLGIILRTHKSDLGIIR